MAVSALKRTNTTKEVKKVNSFRLIIGRYLERGRGQRGKKKNGNSDSLNDSIQTKLVSFYRRHGGSYQNSLIGVKSRKKPQ